MRVAVFFDVQAKWQAMQLVVDDILAQDPVLVIRIGDSVNRGPTKPSRSRLRRLLGHRRLG